MDVNQAMIILQIAQEYGLRPGEMARLRSDNTEP